MANKFWVGGTATWDATAGTKWATTSGGAGGAAVPTAADDVFFDAASGVSTVTLASGVPSAAVCRSINCTGFTGTISHPTATTFNIGDSTAGAGNIALKLVAGMTWSSGGNSSVIQFVSSSATVQTVDWGGKSVNGVSFNGVGGSWQLTSALTTGNGATVSLTAGTLDTNGQTGSWGFFSSSNSNARTLTLGASSITLKGGAGTHWDTTTSTNMTFNRGTSLITINFTSTWGFAGGGLTFYDVTINMPGGIGNTGFSGSNTFRNLTFNATSGTFNFIVPINGTAQTITGLLTLNGGSVLNRIWLQSSTTGQAATFNAASVSLQNTDFMDITAGGAATWSGTGLGDGGGNTGITFPASRTLYRVGAGGGWPDTTKWSLSSGGATGVAAPLCQDDVVIDGNASGNITALNLTTNSPLGRSLNWSGFTGTFGIGGIGNLRIFGSLTLNPSLTMGGNESLQFCGRSNYTITSAGKTYGSNISIQAPNGMYTLQDALSTLSSLTLTLGGFDANNFNVTCTTFDSTNTLIRTLTMGAGNWTLTSGNAGTIFNLNTTVNMTLSSSLVNIIISTASPNTRNFAVGVSGATFNSLTYTVAGSTGLLGINGTNLTINTFNFSDATNARTVQFTNARTYFFTNFNVFGTAGKLMSINTNTSGQKATFSKPSGIVAADYLSLKDTIATGGAYWAAGDNSVDATGNTGWVFGSAVFSLPLSDSVTSSDADSEAIGKGLSDTATSADSETESDGKILSDVVLAVDQMTRIFTATRAVNDSVTSSDARTKAITAPKSDSATLTDAIARVWAARLAFADNVTASDVFDIPQRLAITVNGIDDNNLSAAADGNAFTLNSDTNNATISNEVI